MGHMQLMLYFPAHQAQNVMASRGSPSPRSTLRGDNPRGEFSDLVPAKDEHAVEVKRIAVIGAGIMGGGIAHVSALGGYTTCLLDLDVAFLEKGLDTIRRNLQKGVERRLQCQRLMCPLAERFHQIALHACRMGPVDVTATSWVMRSTAPQYQYRDAVAPDVINADRTSHQTNKIVNDCQCRLPRSLGVAMSHSQHYGFMGTHDQFRFLIAIMVDQRVMKATET